MFINRIGVQETDGAEHLHLLVAEGLRIKRGGWLHCNECEELEEVVLQDVTERPRLFVECATPLNADRLSHSDLDVVNVSAVPDWLKDQVAEAEDQDVANGLFPEIVVDAVDLTFAEDFANLSVELHCGIKVATEGLLDDDASPATLTRLVIEPCSAETANDLWE